MRSLRISAITLAILVSGCSLLPVRTEYVCTEIPIPVRPVLPTLTFEEAQTISRLVYTKLATRESLRRTHIELLEELIREHNRCERPDLAD